MKNEFVLAFNEVLEEKQLPKEVILKALESAMVSAYRRAVNASNAQHVEAQIDPETGKVAIFAEKEVVEEPQDTRTEVSLEEARRIDPNAELNGMVIMETTPKDFGRVAAQTARQVIQQRIRDAERQAQLDFYQKQLGEIVSGVVQAINNQGLSIGLEMRAEGMLGRKDMIPGERFRIHDRVRTLIAEVKDSPRGPQIILSRTHRDFLRRLLENEVPEIFHGVVEIRSIAREPGERAKVAVSATQAGIDPVGACVGIRGVRIQAIVRELHDEKIDVIEWNPDPALFIAKAISPARVLGVYLSDKSSSGKTATVVVPEDQLSLAIGRDGQNARLAAKLTGWRIDIKSLSEATADTVYRLQQEAELAPLAEQEQETLPLLSVMLAKKAEGRPLTPEEYDQMAQFVDRVEKRSAMRLEPPKPSKESQQLEELRAQIPAEAFEQSLLDSGLSEHVANILQGAGYQTTGDLILQMKLQPDDVLRLQGIGPRTMVDITALVDSLLQPPVEVVEEAAPAAEAAVEEEIGQPEAAPAEPVELQPTEATAEVAEVAQPVEEIAAAPAEEVEKAAEAEVELKAGEAEQPVAEGEA
ncbi:MAG: transcription termination/antitermination protein NusA, partial [Chloroflexi bacterium]|nr:transcription termination/antitermination protein NusA [Chloroflexota bacterium]